jgi:hypothetical protein
MNALIRISAEKEKDAEQIAKFLINEANREGRQIAVSKTRKRFGVFEKKVAFGEVREELVN